MLHGNILRIRDENPFGTVYHELQLNFEQPQVSVEDIFS